ncbi:MAG: hypothetical protein M1816_003780 [Peltula sp. TS41687]|nr:MAG: hypothetical protein M1816_003780 [Peltula sp. TS41687]
MWELESRFLTARSPARSHQVSDLTGKEATKVLGDTPSTLVRPANTSEPLERSSDDELSQTLPEQLADPECLFQKADRVTAISAQRAGSRYRYGTENGVVNFFEVGRGQVAELQRSEGDMLIEHITWSRDGRVVVAFADIHGKLIIKSVAASTKGDGIKQSLFHPRGDWLLVYVTTQLWVISIRSVECKHVRTFPISTTVNWMCHPSSEENLLGFGPDSLHVYGWSSWEETASLLIPRSPPNSTTSPTTRADLWGARETIATPTLTADSTLSGTRTEHHHLLLSVDAIGIAPDGDIRRPAVKAYFYAVGHRPEASAAPGLPSSR